MKIPYAIRFAIADLKARLDVRKLSRELSSQSVQRAGQWEALFKRGLEGFAITDVVTDAVAQVGAVYTAVAIISEASASVSWNVMRGDDRVEDHPLRTVFSLPNESLSGTQLFQGTYAWREMRGRSFWLLDGMAGMGDRRFPRRILLLDPDRMKPILRSGELAGWRFTDPRGGSVKDLSVEEVIRFSYFDHRDPNGGLSKLEAARLSVSLNFKSSRLQEMFYRNGGIPPFYLHIPESAGAGMGEPELTRLRIQFRDNYLGISNAWTPPILQRGAELRSVSVNQRDAEWMATQKITTWDILNVFGVPPEIAGYTEDANRSVSVEAKRKFWSGTIRGMLEHVESVLNARFMARFFPGEKFRYNWKAKLFEVLPEETRLSIDAASKLVAMGVPPAEAFRFFDLPVDVEDKPWLQEGWIPFNLAPARRVLEESRQEAPSPSLDGELEEGTEEQGVLPFRSRGSRWPRGPKLREVLWRTFESRLTPLEVAQLSAWRRFLTWLRGEFLSDLSRSSPTRNRFSNLDAILRQGEPRGIGPTKEQTEAAARRFNRRRAELNVQSGYESLVGEIGVEDPFDLFDIEVSKILSERAVAIKSAAFRAADVLREELAEGIELGESIDKLAERLRAKYTEQWRGHAKVVARTEVNAAFSAAREAAMVNNGISSHEWLSARDPLVRPTHEAEDGNVVPIGDRFPVTGLTFPLDPSGPAEEVVNCRCVALPVVS